MHGGDVLMGNDPDARWIRAPRGPQLRGAVARHRDASPASRGRRARRAARPKATGLPPRRYAGLSDGGMGAGPRSRPGHLHAVRQARAVRGRHDRCSTRRGHSASTSTRSAAAAPSAAAARSSRRRATSRSTASSRADAHSRRAEPTRRVRPAPRAGRGAAARVPRARRGRRRRRCPAGEPGPPPGRAQGRAGRATSSSTRSCGCTRSRSSDPALDRPDRRPRGACSRRSRGSGSWTRLDATLTSSAGAAAGARRKGDSGHRRGPRRSRRSPPSGRAPRRGARRGARHRLDDDRRAPRDLADGEVLASDGVMNPQIRFGEDLMSRVSYAMLHEGGAEEMTRVVREAVASLCGGIGASASVPVEEILEIAIVGNPIMHHLLLGIDPTELGRRAVRTRRRRGGPRPAAEIGLPGHPARASTCCRASRATSARTRPGRSWPRRRTSRTRSRSSSTSARTPRSSSAKRDRLLAASSPTGPAFEGAQISGGQRAAPGAIERVRIDRETLEPRFRVIGSSRWSDEVRVRGLDAPDRRHRDLRLGHRRGDRRAAPRRRDHDRRRDRRVARARAARGSSRTAGRSRTCSTRAARRDLGPAGSPHHPERRPRDPAREGRAPRGSGC